MSRAVLLKPPTDNIGDRLEKLMKSTCSRMDMAVLASVEQLSVCLRRPLNRVSLIVLPAASVEDLDRFHELAPLLDNIRVILILPDRDHRTLDRASRLKPCYISYRDGNLTDISAVLTTVFNKQTGWPDHHPAGYRPHPQRGGCGADQPGR